MNVLQSTTKIFIMPSWYTLDRDQPVVTLEERDGCWYHFVAGVKKREATPEEVQMLPLSQPSWIRLAKNEGWVK